MATNIINNVTVSGTTTVSAGTLNVNVQNIDLQPLFLGLLNMSGQYPQSSQPSGKRARFGPRQCDRIDRNGWHHSGHTTAGLGNILATLAIDNDNDYSSASVLRDGTVSSAVLRSVTKSGTAFRPPPASILTPATRRSTSTLKMGNGGNANAHRISIKVMTSTDATFAIRPGQQLASPPAGPSPTPFGHGRLLE